MALRPFIWTLALVWLTVLFRAESFLFSVFSRAASSLASFTVALTPLALLVDGLAIIQWLTAWAVTLPWLPCKALAYTVLKCVWFINGGLRNGFDTAEAWGGEIWVRGARWLRAWAHPDHDP